MLVYLNDTILRREEALISAFDRGFLYGDGLFETVRAYRGTPFLLAEHLDRIAASASELGIAMPERDVISRAVGELIGRNELSDAYVRITLSRGPHTGSLAPEGAEGPTLLIEARELHRYPRELYERGAAVIVSSVTHDSASRIRRHKTTSYIGSVLAKREAKGRGADEAVLLDAAGCVAEGATCNVFCVRDGTLLTPPLDMNILPGVTRAAVIRIARDSDVELREVRFGLAELQSADEVFLTNSLMEVLPVRRINDRSLPAAPGAVTRSLSLAYSGLTVARRE